MSLDVLQVHRTMAPLLQYQKKNTHKATIVESKGCSPIYTCRIRLL